MTTPVAAPGWYADIVKPGTPPRLYVLAESAPRNALHFKALLHGRLVSTDIDVRRFVSDVQDGVLTKIDAPPINSLVLGESGGGWYLQPEETWPKIVSCSAFVRDDGSHFYQAQASRIRGSSGGEHLVATRAFKDQAAAEKWLATEYEWVRIASPYPGTPPVENWEEALAEREREKEAREEAMRRQLEAEERARVEAATRRLRERYAALTAVPSGQLTTDEYAELRRLKRQLRSKA